MQFHEVINNMMEKYNVRATDICCMTGIKRAYLSKLRSGSLVPSDYCIVKAVMNTMPLTTEERIEVTDSYQSVKTSTKYKLAWKSFNQLFRITPTEHMELPTTEVLHNGQVVHGSERMAQVVAGIIAHKPKNIQFVFTPTIYANCTIANLILSNICQRTSFSWVMLLDKEAEMAEYNMMAFVKSIALLCLHPTSVSKYQTDMAAIRNDSVFPFYLMTDDALLLLDETAENGQYFEDTEIIELYRNKFYNIAERSVPFMTMFDDPSTFLTAMASISKVESEDTAIYIISRSPCLVLDCSQQDILRYIADIPNKEVVATMYTAFLSEGSVASSKCHNYFTETGLEEFLVMEEFYELGKKLTKSLPKEKRTKILSDLIKSNRMQEVTSGMMRLPFKTESPLILINLWIDGKMLILYEFGEKSYILMAQDKSITDGFISYMEMMQSCGLIASSEETVREMEKLLTKNAKGAGL